MNQTLGTDQKRIGYFLFLVTGFIVVMILLGGATRLTGSGLSIVEWKPLTGFWPPLTPLDWQRLFQQYQHSPEFNLINSTMTLDAFKGIFWLEFIHRLWGRGIGLVLLIPTVLVLRNQLLRRSLFIPFLIVWGLGILQGGLGWYMVKSGLVKDPHVSPYRLTAHLLLAFLILWISLQTAFPLVSSRKGPSGKFQKRSLAMICLFLITATLGGLVAGHKAGLIYNTFPLMDGRWIPDSMWFLNPFWKNFTENPGTIQFFHRVAATVTFITISLTCLPMIRQVDIPLRRTLWGILGLITLQFILGILTVLYQVPVSLGLLHQACAVVVFVGLVILRCQIKNRDKL